MPSPGRELVVDTSADDVVGDPRGYVRAEGGARRSGQERGVARISQIHVEIFELAAPVRANFHSTPPPTVQPTRVLLPEKVVEIPAPAALNPVRSTPVWTEP